MLSGYQVLAFGYLLFSPLAKRNRYVFFSSGPILAHFWAFWGNNSSKQRLIELKFWSQVILIVAQIPFKAF